jgi:hypothetical protein
LVLTPEERDTLLRWTRRTKTAQALAFRACVVLACAEGAANGTVAAYVRVSWQTIST